jgi:hypothetical protein
MYKITDDSKFRKLELTGNNRTKSGDQIKEWISPEVETMKSKMETWDWTKPFTFEITDNGIVNKYDNLLKNDGLPEYLPDLGRFELFESSNLTDFIEGSFLEQYGLIVSKKAKEILEQFNIGRYKFYPLSINHKGINHNDYFFFKSLTISDEFIDIQNSMIYSQKGFFNSDSRRNITFETYKKIKEFRLNNSGNDIHLVADFIKLGQDFPKYDYFSINEFGIYEKFISPRLANELRQLTGIKMNVTEQINY